VNLSPLPRLNSAHHQDNQVLAPVEYSPSTVPFVFLITDGAVNNERDICLYLKSLQTNVRVNTFGIGQYCNHYFLKVTLGDFNRGRTAAWISEPSPSPFSSYSQMLAQIGKGFSEVAFKSGEVYSQITQLLSMTHSPVLTNGTAAQPSALMIKETFFYCSF
jgi:hypothetical protein